MSEQLQGISRRRLAQGAAWAAPTIVLATAAPALAASDMPACPTCLNAGVGGLFTAQAIAALGTANVSGTSGFNVDSTGCDLSLFVPTYTTAGLGGTMTWSDGSTTAMSAVALGGGTLGQISAISGNYTTNNATFPDGFYGGTLGKHPTKLCFDVQMFFMLIGMIPMPACNYRICYDICGVVGVGVIGFGTGTVNWTGTLCNGTVTPL
ncbi:MAG: hypothetical protein V9G04_04840 [Nocardioides sp.]